MMTMTMIQKGTEKNGMKKEREKTLKKKAVAFFLACVCCFGRETVDGGGRTVFLELFSGGGEESRRERVHPASREKKRERISKKF